MPEETIYEPSAIDKVRIVGTKHALTYFALYMGVGVFFALAAAIFGSWMGIAQTPYASALLLFACGLKAVAVLVENEKQARQKIGNMITAGVALIYAEIRVKTSTPTLPPEPTRAPALPEANVDGTTKTEPSRGGLFIGKNIQGLPPLTVEFVCNYLGNKAEWTEAAMEKMPVPYLYPPARFGKAEGDTVYNQLFHHERGIFCRAGIIGGRAPKQSGKLLVDNPVRMMELIKALPEA